MPKQSNKTVATQAGWFQGLTADFALKMRVSMRHDTESMSHTRIFEKPMRICDNLCTCVFEEIIRVMDKVRRTILRAGSFLGSWRIAVSEVRARGQILACVSVSGRLENTCLDLLNFHSFGDTKR